MQRQALFFLNETNGLNMTNFYGFSFAQRVPFSHEIVKLYRSSFRDINPLQLYALHKGGIDSYRYGNDTWIQEFSMKDLHAQQLYFDDVLGNGKLMLIAKTESGINFYQHQNKNFSLLMKSEDFRENQFSDTYNGWSEPGSVIKFGHFYDDPNLLGILTYRRAHGAKIYAVMKSLLLQNKFPIRLLKTNLDILGNYTQAEFELSDLKNNGQENIIVHGSNGLNIYSLNKRKRLERLMQVPSTSKPNDSEEKLFFPNLTGQLYRDIAVLNSSGLFVYQYNSSVSNYGLIDYQPSFSKVKGWEQDHADSIQFEDIDLDGREDMLFSGPGGISLLSFNNLTNQWQSLLDNSELTISQRHSSVVKVFPASPPITKHPTVFTKYKNQFNSASIVKIEYSLPLEEEFGFQTIHNASSQVQTSTIVPQISKVHVEEEKPHLLLRDQLDYSSIIDAVDKNTGQLHFKLQLIDLKKISSDLELNVFYNGNSQISGHLGVGWSLPQNVIMMDHQMSIFPEDEKYYIILQDLPQELIFDSKNSTDNVYSFKLLNGQSDLQVHHYKDKERWEVDIKDVKLIYGRSENQNSDPIIWEVKWKNWRGVGSSSTGQKQFATAWYLSEVRDRNDNIIRYTYDAINVEIASGKIFTREIYLKTVSDNQGNNIIFSYFSKDTSEYKLHSLADEKGNINTQALQTCYLGGYNLITQNNQQVISFIYKVESGKRFLTKIEQEGDIVSQPVLQFSYSKVSESYNMLEKAVLPNGASIQFDYKLLEKDSSISIRERIGKRYNVQENHRVDYGTDNVLVSYINTQGQVVLRMFNREMTEELYSSLSWKDTSKLPLLGRGAAKSYGVVFANGYLAIILYYNTDQELHLLSKEEGKWLSKCNTFSGEAIIQPSKNFIVVVDNNSTVEVISWNKDSNEWRNDKPFTESRKNKAPLLHRVFERGFIFYDNDLLSIGYQDHEDRWQYNTIKSIPGVITDISETLDKFDLDSNQRDKFFAFFKNNALQVSNNLFILNRWKVEAKNMYSVIDLLVLDKRYRLTKLEQHKFLQDDLNQISIWRENGSGSSFKLVYEIINDKFKVIAKDVRGLILGEIHRQTDNENRRNDQKAEVLKYISQYLENPENKPFLLNPYKYLAALNSQMVICSNKKFTFNGDNWKEDTISEAELKQDMFSVQLGENVVLRKKDSNSSIKLYNQSNNKENLVLDLEVKQLNQTLVRYPIYLAYQQSGAQVTVVKFANDGSIDENYILPWEEKLSPFSSYQTLVTSVDSFNRHSKTLVFRQQLGSLLPNSVITKVTVNFDEGNKRITGYEYNEAKALGSSVYYESISIVPGNDKEYFGWIEETKYLRNQSKKIFNSHGRLLKTVEFEDKPTRAKEYMVDKDNFYLNTTLLDKTGRLEVADFFPYEINDEEVGYYGFEDYEINKIGEKNFTCENKWVFDEKDVVRERFSFTGRNYLSLSGKSVVGKFQPNNQNQKYIASSWVRPHSEMFKLGDIVPYLKVVVSFENKNETVLPLGEVKLQIGNWFYLEVIVDLFYTKEILKHLNEIQTNKTLVEKEDVKLTTSIVIAPSINTTIDVDHVRFSPLKSSFKVNIYDIKTKQVTEVISASGLVERQIYDTYQKQVGSISGYGELKELSTYTKSSSVGRKTQLKSSIIIQPRNGFYEDFAPDSFQKRWKIDSADAWQISPRKLYHLTNDSHSLQLNSNNIDHASCGMRFCFSLQSDDAVIKFNNHLKAMRTGNRADIAFSGIGQSIPLDGELLIVSEGKRVFVWIDGGLYFDGFLNVSLFNLEISGKVKISDLIVFNRPSVEVTYFNMLNEKLQKIVLESENVSIVTQYLYDKLGRQCVTTQPARIERSNTLTYYHNFVTNGNPISPNSVWKVGELQGEVIGVIGEYGYSEVKYCDNPLNEECVVGLPGREFSVSGTYAKRFSSSLDNLFISNLFPESKNYSYRVEHKPGNVEDISVFDSKDNRVAWYVRVPRSKDLLSTYEYDENGKLVKSLPPLYHEKTGTFYKLNSQLNSTSMEEKILQDSLGVNITYDKKGNIITKTTPDSGKIENIYDQNGLLRFVLDYSYSKIENIVYFDYDELGRMKSTGEVISSTPKEELLTLELSDNNTRVYQEFYYSDTQRYPLLREKVTRTITFNGEEPLIEESVLNIDGGTISKRIIIPTQDIQKSVLIGVNKRYEAGRLREMEYPIYIQGVAFRLAYQYDKLGQVTGVGIPGKGNLFASFTYNSYGQVSSEEHLPDSKNNIKRKYSYNSAGFLTNLKDKFLAERVYYTEVSYGGYGYGDGTITSTQFNATWHENCDNSKLGLNENSFVNKHITPEQSASCFHELKKAGYLKDNGHQAKVYYSNLEPTLPIICNYGVTSRHIQNILGTEGFPTHYGHSYDYGNHQELTRAKYFVGREAPVPLQPDSFAKEIYGVNSTASLDIWERLKNSGFLIQDSEKVDISLGHGKRGKSLIRETLPDDLQNINTSYECYELPLERLLIESFSQKLNISLLKMGLQSALFGLSSSHVHQVANEIVQMLEEKGYLDNPFAKEFNDVLERYHSFLPEIIRVLSEHFSKQLGEAEFDVESYNIDANGNHRHFYTGFDRYEIGYRSNTNQVSNVKLNTFASSTDEQIFLMKHDSRGNVIQALHKGIEQINYHSVSNRATKIKLTDSRTIEFCYDARGERVLKRVYDKTGEATKEINYVRDEFGRALIEREITYIADGLQPDVLVTAYIYGPRGLLGFIRSNEFYSVITDHEGSIRLVVKGDEVLSAYDYLPYGNLMREYGNNPEGKISYRYTGQEWDEELGLYNYHARFYDPSIGRFYQVDPKGQYFSPYKYAGNSPLSIIDPDGEFAFLALFIIAGAIAGAYLGGAAANNRWNPGDWDFKSKDTWLWTVGGGVAGGFAPVGLIGSVSTLTAVGFSTGGAIASTVGLGLGASYLSTAAANNEWNPGKWYFESPETWNAAFQGFFCGSSIVAGGHGARIAYQKLGSAWSRGAFISGGVSVGIGSFVISGIQNQWDFSKPGMYYGGFLAVDDAFNLPVFARSAFKSMRRGFKNIVNGISISRGGYDLLGETYNHRFISYADGTYRTSGYRYAYHAAGNMALKLLGTSVPALALAALDEGLDMSNPSTYFAIIRQMAMVNQHWLIGKSVYVRYKVRKELDVLGRKKKLSRTIARNTIALYDLKKRELVPYPEGIDTLAPDTIKKIGKLADSGSPVHENIVIDPLHPVKEVKHGIDNRAISVVMTDKHAVVAFSGNKQGGFLALYNYDNIESFTILGSKYVEDNSLIAGEKVTASDNPIKNQEIIDKIRIQQNEIKKNNARDLLEFLNNNDLSIMLGGLEENVRNAVNVDLRITLEKDLWVGKEDLKQMITTHSKNLNEDLQNLKSSKIAKEKDFEQKREKRIKGEDINKTLTSLRKDKLRIMESIKKVERNIEDRITDYFKTEEEKTNVLLSFITKLGHKFTRWDYNNCAETHALTALHRVQDIFPDQIDYYESAIQDVSLATYKIDSLLGDLEDFPRCDKCMISTGEVRRVMTDPDWLSIPKYQIKKYDDKLADVRRFLVPITNRYFKIDNSSSIRPKRSVFVGQSEVESAPHSATRAGKVNLISSQLIKQRIIDICDTRGSAHKSSSFVKKIFGWMNKGARVKDLVGRWLNDNTTDFASESVERISTSAVDTSGTILLLDTLIRKATGEKYISGNIRNITVHHANGYAINITNGFEKIIKRAARNSKISMIRFNVDFTKVQGEVTKKILSGRYSEIFGVLNSYVQGIRNVREVDGLSVEQFCKFMNTIVSGLSMLLNQSLSKILNDKDYILDVE